ncbi:MAG TPA: AAA family ATPase, partial [Candidatus Aminicenantes bacterium]|nr:AAA family ATPase [Candidatus Aminicenantes bacterium]
SRRATGQKKTLEEEIWGLEQSSNQLAAGLKEKQAHLTTRRQQLDGVRQEKGRGEVDLTAVKKDLHQLQEVSLQELGLELAAIEPGETEFAGQAEEELERVATEMGERLEKMRESDKLSFSAEKEYELLEKDYHFQETQRSDILRSIADMNEAIDRIDRESRQSFSEAFEKVRTSFKRNFEILFEGGSAELVLTGGENVLESGLEIEAQPPGKKLQSMRLLSGGEKTLTSLAFLFAMFEYKPSPFCVFDEVDASLDEANIQRFLRFLHQLKSRTQFIIITHNFKTMEEADFIYGISMDEPGISRIYSIRMTPAERGGKE